MCARPFATPLFYIFEVSYAPKRRMCLCTMSLNQTSTLKPMYAVDAVVLHAQS